MKPISVHRWVTALRSGKYKQAEGHLKEEESINGVLHCAYCCLGVANELADGKIWGDNTLLPSQCILLPDVGWDEVRNNDVPGGTTWNIRIPYLTEPTVLDPKVRIASDLSDSNLTLAYLNDEGFTFDQIADVIEWAFIHGGLERKEVA